MRREHSGLASRESCLSCQWRSTAFFCDLDPEALKVLEKIGFVSIYPRGSVLYSEGQAPSGIYLLCSGGVKLSLSGADGKILITRITHPGEVLGLSSVLTGNPHKATAQTMQTSRVNFIRREDFLKTLAEYLALSTNTVRQLSAECESDADHIRALGLSHSAAEKLANLLLTWCTQQGKPSENGVRMQLLMTHEDISQLIGTSRETVTRLLKHFRNRGVLSIRGSTLTVHNPSELESLVLL